MRQSTRDHVSPPPVGTRSPLRPPAAVTVGASALTTEGPRRSGDGGAGDAPPSARAGGAEVRPPNVLRGSTWSSSIDWIRATGKNHPGHFADIRGVLADRLGGPGELARGLHHYAESERWSEGVSLHFGGNNETWMLEACGGYLSQIPLSQQLGLLRAAYGRGGLSCTRLDLAIDLRFDVPTRLLGRLVKGCEDGQLVRPRSWSPVSNHHRRDVTGEGVYLGSRQSEVVVRVYDKGLETKTAERGRWLRFEGVFKGDRAAEVGRQASEFGADTFPSWALSLVFGAIDFRTDDHKLPRWWAELVAGIDPLRVTVPRPASSFGGFRDQAYRSVGHRLSRAASALGISVAEAAGRFFADVRPQEPGRCDLVQAGLISHLSEGSHSDSITRYGEETIKAAGQETGREQAENGDD